MQTGLSPSPFLITYPRSSLHLMLMSLSTVLVLEESWLRPCLYRCIMPRHVLESLRRIA